MRFLIVASVLACAAAAPSGLLYGHGLGYGLNHGLPLAHGPVLAHAVPTISSGDIHGAAIDAHVVASDHTRAAIDAGRQLHDQAAEIAVEHSWRAVDAANTHAAAVDGHAAGVAPIVAKQLAGHVAPVIGAYGGYAHGGYAHGGYAHAAPLIAHHGGHSSSVVSQSLHQTHPAPIVHAPIIAHSAYGHGYGTHGLAHW